MWLVLGLLPIIKQIYPIHLMSLNLRNTQWDYWTKNKAVITIVPMLNSQPNMKKAIYKFFNTQFQSKSLLLNIYTKKSNKIQKLKVKIPCIALYCSGVICSNPDGGISQYLYGFLFLLGTGMRASLGDRLERKRQNSWKLKHKETKKQEKHKMV